MFKIIYYILICAFFFKMQVYAQKMPCRPNYVGIVYQSKMLDHTPPLSLSMPEDVMRAYLTFYELETNSTYAEFKNFLSISSFLEESIRNLYKNYYILQDFDPILFLKFNTIKFVDSIFRIRPLIFQRDFAQFITKNSPNPIIDRAIFDADVIFQVKVTNKYYNSWNIIFEANIEDTLKGKVIPNYENILIFPDSIFYFKNIPESKKTEIGSKFIFEVPDENEILSSSQFDEYLVFCALPPICIDTASNYFFYYAKQILLGNGKNYILPITKDGFVLDTLNYFGFGTNLPLGEWKTKLRKRLSELKNGAIPASIYDSLIDNSTINISPNPASDFIEISVGANGRSPLQSEIRIFDVFGQTVLSIGVIHELPLRIDVSGLAPGMYFVRIGYKISKFIKI